MRFSTLVTTASLLGSAIAAPAGAYHHHAHKEKRDVVTTTVNAQVTVVVQQGQDGSLTTITKGADAAAAANAAATSVVPEKAVADVASQQTTTTAATAAAAAASTSASSSGSSGSIDTGVSAAGAKGITYSPYTSSGSCKSYDEVASDLAQLTDFSVIRLYGVDCNQVENVLRAKASGQKLFLGIYYVDQIQDGVNTMASAIESYGSWDDVITVSIGNELVNGGQATPSQVGDYVSQGRAALSAAGYSGKVVSVDTFIAVINNPELCNYSDYMAVNAHAYFDYNTPADKAGEWVLEQIQRVWTACGGKKDVLITETGWPSQGETYGVAVPSKQNQETAISSIKEKCGSDAILFSAFNDLWKADGPYGVEKYFGIYSS